MEIKKILIELKEHSPFTLGASLVAIILVIIFRNLQFDTLFHILHPAHLIFSAIVTSAIYYKYKKNILNSLILGITGSIIIGSLSDIIFPYWGGIIFNLNTELHLSILEEPLIIFSTALFGSFIGIYTKVTKFPHFLHVFISIFASLFYILAFSNIWSLTHFLISFLIVFVAVLIPCCISDIVYPLFFIEINKKKTK